MPTDPRVALQRFTDALEEHLAASRARRGENDPTVVEAFRRVADTFDAYDEALMDAFGEVTPLEIYDEDSEQDDDDLDDDDDLEDEDDDDDDIEFEPDESVTPTT